MVVKQPRTANMQSYLEHLTGHPHFSRRSPFFVLHGRNDSLVPVQQARGFVDQLRQVSKQPVVYANCPLQHAFDLGSARAAHTASPWSRSAGSATQHAGSEPRPTVAIPWHWVEVARVGLVKLLSPLDQMFARMEAPRTSTHRRVYCGLRPA